MPWLKTVSVYDWKDASLVRSEYKPVSSPYEEQFALKCYAEYNADPSRYSSYFENIEDGKFTVKRFKQIEQGDLLITCGDSDNLEVWQTMIKNSCISSGMMGKRHMFP